MGHALATQLRLQAIRAQNRLAASPRRGTRIESKDRRVSVYRIVLRTCVWASVAVAATGGKPPQHRCVRERTLSHTHTPWATPCPGCTYSIYLCMPNLMHACMNIYTILYSITLYSRQYKCR